MEYHKTREREGQRGKVKAKWFFKNMLFYVYEFKF